MGPLKSAAINEARIVAERQDMNMNFNAEIRNRLNQELDELRRQVAQRCDLLVQHEADVIDQRVTRAARETAFNFLVQRSERLREVEQALERLHKGSYGKCEHCQSSIGERRLQAVP